jgi:outer membrane protein TolC
MLMQAQVPREKLEDAWKVALSSDHRLQSARFATLSARQTLAAVKATRLPTLNFESSYTALDQIPVLVFDLPFTLPGEPVPLRVQQSLNQAQFPMTRFDVSLPLFTSGRIREGIRAASAGVAATKEQEAGTQLDIKLNVAEAYTNVLRARRGLEVAESMVSSLEGHASDVQNLFDQGLIPRNDLLSVQVTLADARQQVLKARNALDVARATYNRRLNRSLTYAVELDEISPEPVSGDLDALTDEAMAQRPELAGMENQSEALRHQAASVRAGQLPQIGLNGGNTWIHNEFLLHESVWSGTVGLRWNLFDGGQKRNQVKALKTTAESISQMREDAASGIALQVRQAWLDVGETRQRIQVTRNAVAQAEENLKVARDRYREGVGTNTEVLDAEALRTRTLTNDFNAVYDAVMAGIRLRRAVGNL